MVTTGENCRMMKRSPGNSSVGAARRNWASAAFSRAEIASAIQDDLAMVSNV